MRATFTFAFLLTFTLAVSAQEPAGYYSTASGTGATLKTQLYNIIKGHTEVSYTTLWTSFQTTDKKSNGKVWDMYSDVPGGTPPYEYTFITDQCGTISAEGACYDREHSFPKSWFGGTVSPMYTDLFHLIPADGYVNGRRSNYPYGTVAAPTWVSQNGSKVGPCSFTGYSGTVFEPIDAYKGDVARNYLYMVTRYENLVAAWHSNDPNAEAILQANAFPVFEPWFLSLLLQWNSMDPVSQKEIDRNNAVYAIQHNRNPYIDHPEFVNKVWGTAATYATTLAATSIAQTTAVLNGTINPGGIATNYYFEYGPTVTYGSSTPAASGGSGSADQLVSASLSGLSAGTTYHYRVVASNTGGTYYGSDLTFATVSVAAPVATAATDIQAGGFTANWNAVSGASGYQLDVSTSSTFASGASGLLSEGFDAGTTVPGGWAFTNIGGTYTTTGNFGVASPSLKMDATADVIQTPVLPGTASSLKFWIKGQGVDASSALLVQGFNGSSWITVQNITASLPSTGTTYLYNSSTNPALPANLVQFRFTYTKSVGNLSFDDVAVNYSGASTFVPGYENLSVTGTSSAVSGLTPNTAYYYRVRATEALSISGNSNTISLTTGASGSLPAAFTVTGGGSFCAGGTGVPVGLSGSEPGVTYSLLKDNVLTQTLAGTGAALNFGNQLAGTYTMVGTNAYGSTNMTGSAGIVANSLPAVYSVSGGGAYCSGGSGVTVGLSGTQAGVNYQLYNGSASVGSAVAGTGSALSFGLQTAAGTYTVTATNAATACAQAMAGSATVTINALPIVYSVSGGGAYCSGGSGVAVGLSGSQTGVNYQLYNGSAAVGSAVAGTGSALSFGLQTAAGTYTVTATNAATACAQAMAGSATVTINALPIVYSVSGGGAYCSGGSGVAVGLSGSQTSVNYQLYNGSAAVGSAVAGTGSALSFGLQTAAGTYTVTATNAATSCAQAMAGSATVTINALPVVYSVSGGGAYCSGGSGVAVGLSGSQSGVNYQLFNGSAAVGSAVAGTGSALSFGLQTAAGTYTVTAINATTACAQAMAGSATLTINALPIVYSVSGGGTYCSGGLGVAVGLSGSQNGVNYQLYNGSAAVGSVVAGTGSALSFGLQTAAGTYTVTANPGTACAAGMQGNALVIVQPLPVATISGLASVLAGSTSVYSTQTGMTNYSWSVAKGTITSGGTASSASATVKWGTAGTGHVYVNYTNSYGCRAVASADYPVVIRKKNAGEAAWELSQTEPDQAIASAHSSIYAAGRSIIVEAAGDGTIQVFDFTGKLVAVNKVASGQNRINMNASGMFVARLFISGQVLVQKLWIAQ